MPEYYLEPVRKVHKKKIRIIAPTVEDILNEDFDYCTYAEQYIENYEEDDRPLALIFPELNDPSVKKAAKKEFQEYQDKLRETYERKIYLLQYDFEAYYKAGKADKVNKDITEKMKWLTREYKANLDALKDSYDLSDLNNERENYLKQMAEANAKTLKNCEELKKQIEEAKRLKQMAEAKQKEKLKAESIARTQAYFEGKIKLSDLRPCDVKYLNFKENAKERLAIKIVIVKASVPNPDDYTLGQLYSMVTDEESKTDGHKVPKTK